MLSKISIAKLLNNWNFICEYEKLSETFIEIHYNKVNWEFISMYQKLSDEFIEKHSNKVNWVYIYLCIKNYLSPLLKNSLLK